MKQAFGHQIAAIEALDMIDESGTNATILLLSSEPRARTGLREALEHAGYLVMSATNLAVAVDALSSCPIDLLITHPYIDSMPGHEAAKYLRGKNPGMAVLIVAGLLDDDRYLYRAELENFDIFPEPFTAAQFIAEVREILKRTWEHEPPATLQVC
jgi:DNA-binding response OmpR family regulator